MPTLNPELFRATVRVADWAHDTFEVEAIRGREAMNGAYEMTVTAISRDIDSPFERELLTQPSSLIWSCGDHCRAFHGLIAAVRLDGLRGTATSRVTQLTLKLVPRLWLLHQRTNSRIFQRVNVPEIVRAILTPCFIPSRWVLEHEYPKLDYCTQYEETDYAFVSRITAEAGIFMFFEQPALPDPLGDLMSEGLAAATSRLRAASQELGDLASHLTGIDGLVSAPREVVVFADTANAYPGIASDAPPWDIVANELMRVAGTVAGATGAGGGVNQVAGIVDSIATGLGVELPDFSAPTLHMHHPSGAIAHPDERTVTSFDSKRRVRPTSTEFWEFDPERPGTRLRAHHHEREFGGGPFAGAQGAVESLTSLGRAMADGGAGQAVDQRLASGLGEGLEQAGRELRRVGQLFGRERPFEVYEHHSGFLFPHWEYEKHEPRRMMKGVRRDVDVSFGRSPCPWIAAGYRFQLEGHDVGRLNRTYAITAVVHELTRDGAEGGRTYHNRFECVPADVPFVPERLPRRCIQACETAVVVGGDSTHIHTDPHMHIKVQFHWDREGHGDDSSSCWIRVMQPWAGAAMGAQFIPRMGTEVVVAFLGGDPDKPIVLGGVYNGVHPPPFNLPEQRTRSGFRTQSTPGHDGYNELSFDDAAGSEQINVRAQRDLDMLVRRDRTINVEHDDHTTIHNDQRLHVHGQSHMRFDGDRQIEARGGEAIHVEGQRSVTVDGESIQRMRRDHQLHVGGNERHETVGGRQILSHGDVVERIHGNLTRMVGLHGSPRSLVSHAEGDIRSTASGAIQLQADSEIVLTCGQSSLRITPDVVLIHSPEIVLQGDGARLRLSDSALRLQSDDKIQGLAQTVLLTSSGAALALSSEAAVDGARILLNSPASAEDSVDTSSIEPTVIELVDQEGNPIPNQPYRITFSDGSERSGMLDEEGRAELELERDGEVTFPGLADVEAS